MYSINDRHEPTITTHPLFYSQNLSSPMISCRNLRFREDVWDLSRLDSKAICCRLEATRLQPALLRCLHAALWDWRTQLYNKSRLKKWCLTSTCLIHNLLPAWLGSNQADCLSHCPSDMVWYIIWASYSLDVVNWGSRFISSPRWAEYYIVLARCGIDY